MLNVMRIFGIAIDRGTVYELERVTALKGIEIVRGDKLVHVKGSHHVHANPGTFTDKKTIELPLESEDK